MNAEFTGKTESLYHFGVFEILDLLTSNTSILQIHLENASL